MLINKPILDVFITKFLLALKDANISSNKDLEGITERDLPISWVDDNPECISIEGNKSSTCFVLTYKIGKLGLEGPLSVCIDNDNYEVLLRCTRLFDDYEVLINDKDNNIYQQKVSFGTLNNALEELAMIKVMED